MFPIAARGYYFVTQSTDLVVGNVSAWCACRKVPFNELVYVRFAVRSTIEIRTLTRSNGFAMRTWTAPAGSRVWRSPWKGFSASTTASLKSACRSTTWPCKKTLGAGNYSNWKGNSIFVFVFPEMLSFYACNKLVVLCRSPLSHWNYAIASCSILWVYICVYDSYVQSAR